MSEPLSSRDRALVEIAEERGRQDAKWGEQNHPLLDPTLSRMKDLWGSVGRMPFVDQVALFYEVPVANLARIRCQANGPDRDNWAAILLEEYAEFLEAAARGDDRAARAELVQLGAVAAAAVEAMDRRKT